MRETRRPKSGSSGRDEYQKLMKTMYIMSSIKKAVKQNDIEFLVGEKRSKLRTEPNSADFEKAAHNTLIEVRKKYDSIKKERMKKFQDSEKLKDVVKIVAKEENELKTRLRDCRIKSQTCSGWANEAGIELEFKTVDKKVLDHMCWRLKEDIKFYKERCLINKNKLEKSSFSLMGMKSEYEKLRTETINANGLLYKLRKNISDEEHERLYHLGDMKNLVFEKEAQEKNEKQRLEFEEEEAEKALLAKDSEEENWNSLLLTHLFIKRLLENKINNEMVKFQTVETAFTRVKSRTDVKDVDDLVKKFLSREKVYGELLSEVTKTNEKLKSLKAEHNNLIEQRASLYEKQEHLANIEYTSYNLPNKGLKAPNRISGVANSIKTLKIKFEEWMIYQLRRICKGSRKEQIVQKSLKDYDRNIGKLFKLYLENLEEFIDKSDLEDCPEPLLITQNNDSILVENQSFMEPKERTEIKNVSKLSIVENDFTVRTDRANEENLNYKLEEEFSIINHQRQEVHQTNEKFMKDLRAKYLDLRKKKVESK